MSDQTTPRPWAGGTEDDGPHCLIGARGLLFCRVVDAPGHNAIANASLIVRAVNAHDELEAEVKRLREELAAARLAADTLGALLTRRDSHEGAGTSDPTIALAVRDRARAGRAGHE